MPAKILMIDNSPIKRGRSPKEIINPGTDTFKRHTMDLDKSALLDISRKREGYSL